MGVQTRYQQLMLTTPINSSHAWTLGFKSKLVNANCFKPIGLCRGIWFGDYPFEFVEPVFLMQLVLGSLLTTFCQLLFRPLGQTSIVSQIMAGFVAGPSALGRNQTFKEKLFPQQSKYVQETLSICFSIFIFFLAGVRMDISTIKNSGKKEWTIGIVTFILPLFLSVPTAFIFKRFLTLEKPVHKGIVSVAFLKSTTSFHVVASFLHELKLLNSELGRLAMSSSMISGLLSYITLDIGMTVKQTIMNGDGWDVCFKLMASTVAICCFIVYVVRPMMHKIVKITEKGKPIKESYFCSILIMILGCTFVSEALGKRVALTAAFLGACVPEGPPLGSALVEKLDCFVNAVFLPLYLVVNFADADLTGVNPKSFFTILFLALLATMGKFIGTTVSCFYLDIPLRESLPLGLVLSSIGLLDLQFYKSAQLLGYINSTTFGVMSLLTVIVTGLIGPLVRIIYNPSRKYISYKRRTLQHSKRHSELPILVCVYNQENVPALINLLEATHPIRDQPMAIYLLQLVELVGRTTPLLISYQPDKANLGGSQRSGGYCPVVNAFKIFERNNPGVNSMQPFTSIAPYATMHDDICTLAFDKKVCFIILPYHKQWHIDRVVESVSHRNINQNVLKMAPCSVGVLVDCGALNGSRSILESWAYFRVAMIFLGGADDREALAFATRVAQNPNVNLTVIHLVPIGDNIHNMNVMERMLDEDVITEFRLATISSSDRVLYTEEGVTDGMGTINVIRSVDNSYDLILVGRRHEQDSPLLEGSTEWGGFPEIGFIGDMLTSADFNRRVLILVVQQHDLGNPKFRHLDSL